MEFKDQIKNLEQNFTLEPLKVEYNFCDFKQIKNKIFTAQEYLDSILEDKDYEKQVFNNEDNSIILEIEKFVIE